MKKLINDPADVVVEALRGMAAAHAELRVDLENRVVFRGDAPVQGKVGLVSGASTVRPTSPSWGRKFPTKKSYT